MALVKNAINDKLISNRAEISGTPGGKILLEKMEFTKEEKMEC